MNRALRQLWLCFAVSVGVVMVLISLLEAPTRVHAEPVAMPTLYHEGVSDRDATPHAMEPSLFPLPAAEDRASTEMISSS